METRFLNHSLGVRSPLALSVAGGGSDAWVSLSFAFHSAGGDFVVPGCLHYREPHSDLGKFTPNTGPGGLVPFMSASYWLRPLTTRDEATRVDVCGGVRLLLLYCLTS